MVAAFKNVFGEDLSISSGPWCWIRGCLDNGEIVKWMTVTGKGWEILTYIITAFMYIYLKYYMIKRVSNAFNCMLTKNMKAKVEKIYIKDQFSVKTRIFVMIWIFKLPLQYFASSN